MARKILFPLCFVLALALAACTPAGQTAAQDDGTTHAFEISWHMI